MSEGYDEIGLPVTTTNRKLYAKRSCMSCLGRGEVKFLFKKGEVVDQAAQLEDCHCVGRRYSRLRKEVDKRLAKALAGVEDKEAIEGARQSALKAILAELGFGGKDEQV